MLQRYAKVAAVVVCLLCLAGTGNAEQVTVSGQVVGPDDQPLPDCRVFAFYYTPETEAASAETASDATGGFSFTLQVHDFRINYVNVVAAKAGLAVDWRGVEPGKEVTLKLGARPVACTGTVVDSEGNPISGAEVCVRTLRRTGDTGQSRQYLSLSPESFLRDTTDEAGRFEIAGPPPDIQAGLTVATQGWAQLTSEPMSFAERAPQLAMVPESTISGRITHEGQPVAGVKVLTYGPGPYGARGESVSGQDGTYQLKQLYLGFYHVRVEPPEGLAARLSEHIGLSAGQHLTGVDFELTPGGLVQGTVTAEETGEPVAGVRVGAQGAVRSVTTAESGTYTLRLPAGEARIYCRGGGSRQLEPVGDRERQVEVVEGETVTGVDFVVRERQPEILRGQVLLPDGQPAVGVEVCVVGGYGRPPGADGLRASTDAEGRFELEMPDQPVPPSGMGMGRPVYVFARDADQGLVGMAVVPDTAATVKVGLQQASYLLGKAVGVEDQPVPNISVRVYMRTGGGDRRSPWTNLPAEFTADNQGDLRIGPLPPGVPIMVQPVERFAQLTVGGAWREVGEMTLAPGEERELPALRVNLQGRSVRGWVGDEQQRPIAGAIVFGSGSRGYSISQASAYADEQGYFKLSGLPMQGMVTIVAAHPFRPLFAAEEIDPDWGFEPGLVLRPTGSVVGQLLDEQREPVADAGVTVRGGVADYGMSPELSLRLHAAGFTVNTYTDQDGRWRTDGIIPGIEYQVYSQPSDGGSSYASTQFTAQPGQTVDLGEMVLEQRNR